MIRRPYTPRLTEKMQNRHNRQASPAKTTVPTAQNSDSDDEFITLSHEYKNRKYGIYYENQRIKQLREKKKKQMKAKSAYISQQNSFNELPIKEEKNLELHGQKIVGKSITHIRSNIFDQYPPHQVPHDLKVVNPGAHPSQVAFKARIETLKRIEERRNPPGINYNDIMLASRELRRLSSLK